MSGLRNMIVLVCVAVLVYTTSAQIGAPGGWTNLQSNAANVQDIATFAVQEMDKNSNSSYALELHNIQSARSQVVNGVNYQLALEVKEAACQRNSTNRLGCRNPTAIPSQTCNVVVWDQSHTSTRTLTSSDCQ